ncbi:MAG: glycosyltransferase family 4 protein [Acidimicrobiales bacterium]
MRLTVVNQFYAPDISPTAQLATSLAEHRAERGDHVTIVTGRAGYLEDLTPTGVVRTGPELRIRRVWTPGLGKSSRGRRLLGYLAFFLGAAPRLVVMRRQDVIVAMTTPPFVLLTAVLHRLLHPRTRVVLWSMDCYPDAAERFGELATGGWAANVLRRFNRWLFRRVDVVVGLDGAMVELLRTQYATSATRPAFEVIPNWERIEQFPGEAAVPSELYRSIDVAGRAVVLYLGNTGVGHAFGTVLDAAADLADDALFLFVGGGARWADLEDEVAASGLRNVVLRGYVPKEDTPGVMAGAHLALITLDDRSLGVMSPSKLHANLAAGLPVVYVGPEGSNVDEAIQRYGVGRSVRHGDVKAFIGAVRELLGDEAARQRARRAFEEHYSDVAVLPAFDRVIESAG